MKTALLLLSIIVAQFVPPVRAQVVEQPAQPIGAAATVLHYYFNIQTALARDSMDNVAVSAGVIAEIVRKDTTGAFPAQLARQAEALAKASDLPTARPIFKAVSGYLIQFLKTSNVPAGTYHEVHCPQANVNWLQREKTVRNPYLGKSQPGCGTFVS